MSIELEKFEIIGNSIVLKKFFDNGNIVISKNTLKHNKDNNDKISLSFIFLDIFLI
ncbi:hypothetical protein [Fusobacterium watanabei]|uniref:hypothetical protein n=1 Tax=Fusobacterium watanabei TaxID=2686067 RepID=UPI003BF8E5A8